MKIVADENIAFAAEFFAPLGELVLLPGRAITRADLQDADVLLVRSVTLVNSELLAGTAVRFVGSCTIGRDHVDEVWLAAQGVRFAYAPGCNARAVVEYVLSALLALQVDIRDGTRIGIVGCGNVGARLLRCLQKGGADVCAYDPFITDTTLPLVSLDNVLQCDVVCLHTPLTRSGPYPTFHLFDETVLSRLKPGAVLLNAGRGAVIDNTALLQILRRRSDLRVVLDVWENEPAIDLALLQRVAIATPHIAGYSAEGKWRGTAMVSAALRDFLGIEQQEPVVNLTGAVKPYAVLADDAALRQQYALYGAPAFDRLRKDYQPRRECPLVLAGMAL